MALKTCPHCGHNVSDQAIKCPSCGKDPRYTDFQLEQREQQHKKKRKTAIIIVAAAVVFLATLYFSLLRPAIKYQSACRALESQDYRTAAESFISLGEYRDSGKLAQKAMYSYVNAHMNSKDATSVRYVKKLQQLGYPGADDLSSRLYNGGPLFLPAPTLITGIPSQNSTTATPFTSMRRLAEESPAKH